MKKTWVILVNAPGGPFLIAGEEAGKPAVYETEEEAELVVSMTGICGAFPTKVVELPTA